MKQQTLMPKEWKLVKLGEISDSYAGGTPSRSNKGFYGGNILWVKSGEVSNRNIIDTEEKITERGLEESSAKRVPADTLLVAMYGATAGKVGILRKEATTNQAVLAIVNNKGLFNTEFLFYLLSSKTDKLVNTTQGTGQPNLSKTLIESLELIIPIDIKEQTAIAKILSTVSMASSIVEREIQATERLKRGIMVKLLENQKWKIVKLGEIAVFVKGKKPTSMTDGPKEGYLPYLSTDYLRENLETKYIASSEDIVLVKEGEIILLWDGSNAGEFFEGRNGVLSTTMVKFDIKNEIYQKYLLYLLKSKQSYLQGQTNGTGIPHVDRKVLLNIDVALPPIKEQKRIAEILSTIDKKLELQKTRKEKLERLKRGLMDELLTGKKRVNVERVLGEEND